MFNLEIKFPTLIDILQETDPALHTKVFVDAANDIAFRALSKTNSKIKRKWNLEFKKTTAYDWMIASKVDNKYSKRRGYVNFKSSKVERPLIEISMSGSPINDKRFDYKFDTEMQLLANNVKKSQALTKRTAKLLKKDKFALNRPRVKILKSKSATMLTKAFYATMKSGHSGIFRRMEDGKIIELRTITLASMFEQVDYASIFEQHHKDNMTKRYDHYLSKALRRR